MYLLLEKNRAIACYTKALDLRKDKSFRRVTEEGYCWHIVLNKYNGTLNFVIRKALLP
ncbi:hypothetical protein COO91_08387 [Nostoc flagelliforme CCNUN1]|uniref:Uncharacterized protein n=1 Tax=Nostoc flagelliforme CCNUN1 TaxID=2038116 RepID=A0A2K8T3S5_9NOSO|nr:hypothetical protein COO91_08387 [Nostoc flagelliforme CCNUN1]